MADKYDELAAKFGGTDQAAGGGAVDYDALAAKFGAAESARPVQSKPMDTELTTGERIATGINEMLGGAVEKIAPYARGFVQGAADPVVGTAQLAANLAGQGGAINKAIADKERQSEMLGTSGVARFAGGVASPVNLIAAARLAKAPSVMQGAGLGVASGLMQPVTEGPSFAAKKAEQALIGGAAGGLGTMAIKGVSGALSPQLSEAQRLLAREGVEMTPGQLAGGAVSRFEEKLTSQPFVGGAITEGRERGVEQFNKAVLNRVLAPIGKTTDKIGREGFKEVKQEIGKAYDDVLSKIAVTADQSFVNDLVNLRSAAQNLPEAQAKQFDNLLENLVLSRFTTAGKMSGEQMKKVESELGRKASNYMRDASADVRDLGSALREAQNILRQTVMRSNPQKAGELQKINEAFANYARVRRATTGLGTDEGVFTPAQLLNAVKAEDKTVGKAGFGQGKATLQDIAEAGKTVLGNRVPNSGTADRLAAQLGSPLAIPSMAGGALAGIPAAAIYSSPVSRLLNRAATAERGRRAQRLADLLRASSAPLVIGGVGAIQ